MKFFFIVLTILIALLVVFFTFNSYIYDKKQEGELPHNYREVMFWVSGEPVRLTHGKAEVITALGGESKTIIRYFGNEVMHDIDGNGTDDIVFLITQESGGSGTFFYVVAALKHESGYQGTHAVYIGDRIAPQSTNAAEGRQVVVHYADRAPGEPFSVTPSIGKSLYLLLDTETLQFGEVIQGFEGEES